MSRKNPLAKPSLETARVPVPSAPVEEFFKNVQKSRRHGRIKEHPRTTARQRPCAKASDRAPRSRASELGGIQKIPDGAPLRPPAVALHAGVVLGNGRSVHVVARIPVASAEPERIGQRELPRRGREVRAIGVDDPLVRLEDGLLYGRGQPYGLLDASLERMPERQVTHVGLQILRLGKPRNRVLRRDAGDVDGGLHGRLERAFGKVRRACTALSPSDPRAERQDTLLGVLYGVDLPHAHRHAQPLVVAHLGACAVRPQRLRTLHRPSGELLRAHFDFILHFHSPSYAFTGLRTSDVLPAIPLS